MLESSGLGFHWSGDPLLSVASLPWRLRPFITPHQLEAFFFPEMGKTPAFALKMSSLVVYRVTMATGRRAGTLLRHYYRSRRAECDMVAFSDVSDPPSLTKRRV